MTHEEIFESYLNDECPQCKLYVHNDSGYGHTEDGGKCMARYFRCRSCGCEYTVGYRRSRMYIESEITLNGNKK